MYDNSGNLAILKDKLGGTETRYVYDLADRLVRMEDSAGLTVTYEYDDAAGMRVIRYTYTDPWNLDMRIQATGTGSAFNACARLKKKKEKSKQNSVPQKRRTTQPSRSFFAKVFVDC